MTQSGELIPESVTARVQIDAGDCSKIAHECKTHLIAILGAKRVLYKLEQYFALATAL